MSKKKPRHLKSRPMAFRANPENALDARFLEIVDREAERGVGLRDLVIQAVLFAHDNKYLYQQLDRVDQSSLARLEERVRQLPTEAEFQNFYSLLSYLADVVESGGAIAHRGADGNLVESELPAGIRSAIDNFTGNGAVMEDYYHDDD